MKIIRQVIIVLIIIPMIIFVNQSAAGAITVTQLIGFEQFAVFTITDVHGVEREIQRCSYRSGELTVRCEIVYPGIEPGLKYPTLVLCHGGVAGIYRRMRVKALELADMGYLVVMPTYRGEDGSGGEIEIAKGEVDDVLACVELLRENEIVDSNRIAIIGSSHGALIAAFAGARDRTLPAIVCAYGVMHIHEWWQYLIDTDQYDWSDELSRKIYGNGPDDRPEEFEIRSGVMAACDIISPVMLVQGDSDRLVPVSQAEAMASAFESCGKGNFIYNKYENVGHGFIWLSSADLPRRSSEQVNTAYRAWDDILEFVQTCWDIS